MVLLASLAAVLASGRALAAPTIQGVQVADLTPFGFTVMWDVSEPSTSGITIYSDADGTDDITTQFEVTVYPLIGGDPAAADELAAEAAEEALRSASHSKGLVRLAVEGGRPSTTYFYKVHSTAGGETTESPAGAPNAVTTAGSNAFLERSQQFLVGVNLPEPLGSIVTVESAGTVYPVSAVVGDGARENEAFLNLSQMFDLVGANWEPTGLTSLTITVRARFGVNSAASFDIEFPGDPFSVGMTLLVPVGGCSGFNTACAEASFDENGAEGNCDILTPLAAGTECRASAGVCDVAEFCDGINAECPADQFDPFMCVDSNICTSDVCSDGSCENNPVQDGTTCADADVCDGEETCQGGSCMAGSPLECDDGDACTADSCDPSVGCLNTEITGCRGSGHFMVYKSRTTTGTPRFVRFGPVMLSDQFGSDHYNIWKLNQLGLPANKNNEGLGDPITHLAEYQVKAVSGTPRFEPKTDIRVINQCNDVLIEVTKVSSVLVPTLRDNDSPTEAPDPNAHNVDHFLCYRAKAPKLPRGMQVEVSDEFQSRRYDLKKITKLCNPTAKSGPAPLEPATIKNPENHLVCYQAKVARKLIPQAGCGCDTAQDDNCAGTTITPRPEKHTRLTGVHINNQFGPLQLNTIREFEFCIPSEKILP